MQRNAGGYSGTVTDTFRTLFISRKYPPSKGGMETAAVNLYERLAEVRPVKLVKFGWSNKMLPVSMALLLVRGLWHAASRSTDVVVIQDGVLAPVGRIIGALTRKPVVVIIHGLEVTHTGSVHRALMRWSLPHAALLVAVSENTKRLIAEQYPTARVTVVPNGVSDEFYVERSRAELDTAVAALAGLPVERVATSTILLTVGRLVPRKGVRWFTTNVIPSLPERFLYLVVGVGNERAGIEEAIVDASLADRVMLLGAVPGEGLLDIYNRADVFVMPNVPVEADVEGFGLVALEASSTGTPVVASNIDGIPDAVRSPGNGVLVAAADAEAYEAAILAVDSSPEARARTRAFTLDNYSWAASARGFDAALTSVTSTRR